MSEELELKPCPFCGRQCLKIFYAGDGYYVECANCRARGPFSTVARVGMRCPDHFFASAEKEAESAWTRRTPEPGTSVIRWTRYDGTPETMPETDGIGILLFREYNYCTVDFYLRYNSEDKPKIFINDFPCELIIGDLWAYLPEPPEGME